MDLVTVINAKRAQIASAREELQELLRKQGEEFLSEGLKPFWEKYPDIRTIHWNQYTPYFNDGEECVFDVGEIMFSRKDSSELSGTYDDESGDEENMFARRWDGQTKRYIDPEGITGEMKLDARAVAGMIRELDLKTLFGDHLYVRVDRHGVQTEEFEHD